MPRLLALREEGTLAMLLKRLERTRPMDTEKIANLTQRITDRERKARRGLSKKESGFKLPFQL